MQTCSKRAPRLGQVMRWQQHSCCLAEESVEFRILVSCVLWCLLLFHNEKGEKTKEYRRWGSNPRSRACEAHVLTTRRHLRLFVARYYNINIKYQNSFLIFFCARSEEVTIGFRWAPTHNNTTLGAAGRRSQKKKQKQQEHWLTTCPLDCLYALTTTTSLRIK